jgi:hypothetical protein
MESFSEFLIANNKSVTPIKVTSFMVGPGNCQRNSWASSILLVTADGIIDNKRSIGYLFKIARIKRNAQPKTRKLIFFLFKRDGEPNRCATR